MSFWKRFSMSSGFGSQNKTTRKRKIKISCNQRPDFETASMDTIFNRRDEEDTPSFPRKILESCIRFTASIFKYLLPFNYNLPWKLLTLFSFLCMIFVALIAGQGSSEGLPITFIGGIIFGFILNTIIFSMLLASLLMSFLPLSVDSSKSKKGSTDRIGNLIRKNSVTGSDSLSTADISDISPDDDPPTGAGPSLDKTGDNSSFEELAYPARDLSGLNDEDYKGWMIEFFGDYEQRNKSDIKLKHMFIKLESRILSICKPKSGHDESSVIPAFVQQKSYDLNKVKRFSVYLLLPKNVRNRQRWIWSKKYPIRLNFINVNGPEAVSKQQSDQSQAEENVKITLLAKSCREKEEWFRRFKRIMDNNKMVNLDLKLSDYASVSDKRPSIQSEASTSSDKSSKSALPASPITFTSKHADTIKGILKKLVDNQNSSSDNNQNKNQDLPRTKSCDTLLVDDEPKNLTSFATDFRESSFEGGDSTLTKETAELYSNAIELTNLKESQPTLDYVEYIQRVIETGQDVSSTCSWFNALTGRIFFDVLSRNYWALWFKRKIQRKLYRIRLPYFMQTLTLTEIDLGTNAPQFSNVLSHKFDSSGLSIDFDMSYSGSLTLTFETKLNLLKIKSGNASANSFNNNVASAGSPSSSGSSNIPNQEACYKGNYLNGDACSDSSNKPTLSSSGSGDSSHSDDSESEFSPNSCDEAETDEISDWEDYGAEKTRQNIVRIVDKIASSRYFQQATENKYIKKKLQDISNCPLVLKVEIQSLNGVMKLNIPPPQTDRLWYGFKPNPELILKALPKMGDRELNLSPVIDWIERKLVEEFKKILVIPNMEDIVLPVLKSDHLAYVASTK